MSSKYVHTCLRVRDPEASQRFYGALGFEPRGRLNFSSAYNLSQDEAQVREQFLIRAQVRVALQHR